MEIPICSLLIVNYNGRKYLDRCLLAIEHLDYPEDRVEILLIDNGSDDGSELEAQSSHPRVRLLRNPVNNYAAALNVGLSKSKGSYVAFINNDVFLSASWLKTLVEAMHRDSRVGCAGGKILLEDGRINSVGHEALPDFYWKDSGFGEDDHGQYDSQREVSGLCWAAVLFRRTCLQDVAPIDEDFVFYYEDVDTSLRCHQHGWKILYIPGARAEHVFHGSSGGVRFAEYFSDRGRLILVAKFHPEMLPMAVQTTRFLSRREIESLYDTLPIVMKKLAENHPANVFETVLEQLADCLIPIFGALAVDHLMRRMQVILGHRRMSIGFYDQALHVIGGGQRYGCTMAAALQSRFDVTLLSNRPVELEDLQSWYHLGLSECRLKMIPLPYFDELGPWIDSAAVRGDVPNPFAAVAVESKEFDIFVNVNMLTMVYPLSPFSIFVCHFPDPPRRCNFAADRYSAFVVSSFYAAHWVRRLWGLEPDLLVYPPVDMEASPTEKENLILSAARFEPGGSKKQRELIQAFEGLWKSHLDLLRDWRLVLVGGSLPENAYREEIEHLAGKSAAPVEVHVNVPFAELQGLYARAKVFWHACGLGEKEPRLVEHFGMTTVEAMQNRCVPIVIDGGGQREIVEHGRSGYRFSTVGDLCHYTLEVIANPGLMAQLQQAAYERGQTFARKRFEETVHQLFTALEEEYRTPHAPNPGEIVGNRRRASLFYGPVARQAAARLQWNGL